MSWRGLRFGAMIVGICIAVSDHAYAQRPGGSRGGGASARGGCRQSNAEPSGGSGARSSISARSSGSGGISERMIRQLAYETALNQARQEQWLYEQQLVREAEKAARIKEAKRVEVIQRRRAEMNAQEAARRNTPRKTGS